MTVLAPNLFRVGMFPIERINEDLKELLSTTRAEIFVSYKPMWYEVGDIELVTLELELL